MGVLVLNYIYYNRGDLCDLEKGSNSNSLSMIIIWFFSQNLMRHLSWMVDDSREFDFVITSIVNSMFAVIVYIL